MLTWKMTASMPGTTQSQLGQMSTPGCSSLSDHKSSTLLKVRPAGTGSPENDLTGDDGEANLFLSMKMYVEGAPEAAIS